MALYPKAIKKLIPAGSNDPAIKPIGAILHVDAGNAGGVALYNYFATASGGIESHFHIQKDGKVYQYRDTDREADANYKGNSFFLDGERRGYISIETQGLEMGEWTDAQLSSIKELLTWLSETHDFPLQVPSTPKSPGVGYHVLFGAPGAWTPVSKSCPGPNRIKQYRSIIVPWMKNETEEETEEVVTQSDEPRIDGAVRLERKAVKSAEVKLVKLEEGVKPGRRHPQVRLLQQLLLKAGYGPIRGSISNYYGENTENAVARFHKKNPRLSDNPNGFDGEIGPKGFEELQKEANG
jgi:hypothetical protein